MTGLALLEIYRRHQLAAGALFWMPTTVLYLISRHGFETALTLNAVYYVTVVALEVPSGWFSDRVSRVLALRLTAVSWLVAHVLFVTAPGAAGSGLALALLATGYAFASGTDVTLHYDTLESLGLADEFDRREARTRRGLLLVTAATAITGGVLGMIDLRLPYAASLVAVAVQLGCALRLREPPRQSTPRRLGVDLLASVARLRHPALAWLAICVVAQVALVHLAADLGGPYLTDTIGEAVDEPTTAALVTGIVAATAALVGASTITVLPTLARRLGVAITMVLAVAVPTLAVTAMAIVSTVWVIPLLAARGVASAATSVLAPQIVGGFVPRESRATVLSVNSLGGRLLYGGVLVGVAAASGREITSGFTTAAVIAASSCAVVVLATIVLGTGRLSGVHDHQHEHPALAHTHWHHHDDDHHGHEHDPPFVGAHSHRHRHDELAHRHPHSSDEHHDHH